MKIYRDKSNNRDYYKISQIVRKYKKKDHPYIYLELKERKKKDEFIDIEELNTFIFEEKSFLEDNSSIEFLQLDKFKKKKKTKFFSCFR